MWNVGWRTAWREGAGRVLLPVQKTFILHAQHKNVSYCSSGQCIWDWCYVTDSLYIQTGSDFIALTFISSLIVPLPSPKRLD
jgi:hypothetical protein